MPLEQGSNSVIRLYKLEQEGQTEITELKDNLNQVIHKRVTITFNANGGSGGSTQVRTWGVENIINPGTPSRSNYTFNGWYTAASGGSKLSFPFEAGNANVTYYAQWSAQSSPTTAAPTVGTPGCAVISGTNNLTAYITNNDTSTVTLRNRNLVIGTLAGGASKSFNVGSGFSTPYYYNISITATASGKTESSSVSRSGTANYCISMEL